MKIYVASKYGRKDEMRAVVRQIQEAGHEVTAQWISQDQDEGRAGAEQDVADVDRADAILFFAQIHGTMHPGGGRHFEMGYAYGRGKAVCVIGGCETIFCHLPAIHHFDTVPQFIRWANGVEGKSEAQSEV